MIHFKIFPVIFFVMVFSSCHLMAKDKRAENEMGETTATRGLAAADEPLYQICAKDRNTMNRNWKGYVEITGGETDKTWPSKIFSGSAECVWVKESQFNHLSIMTVKMSVYGKINIDEHSRSISSLYETRVDYICGPLTPKRPNRCPKTNYIFTREVMKRTETIPQPNLPKSHTYPSPVDLRGL